MLSAYIKHQKLTPVSHHIVADSINYLQCVFLFGTPDWDGLDKWAHFEKDGTVYDIHLTDNRIRPEDGLNLTEGKWKLYLHGSLYSGGETVQRITTNQVELTVEPTGTMDGQPFDELPPSAAEQILARLEEMTDHQYTLTDEDKKEIAGMIAADSTISAEDLGKIASSVPNSGVVSDGNELVMQRTDGDSVVDLFSVPLPASGGGTGETWELIGEVTVTEDVSQIAITTDLQGNEFQLKKVLVMGILYPTTSSDGRSDVGTRIGFKKEDSLAWLSNCREVGGVAHESTDEKRIFQCVAEDMGGHIITVVMDSSYNNLAAYANMNPRGYRDYIKEQDMLERGGRPAPINAVKWGSYVKAIGPNSRIVVYGVRA